MGVNKPVAGSQDSATLASPRSSAQTIHKLPEGIPAARTQEGSGVSAGAAIAVPVDRGHPRYQEPLGASVSVVANQAAASPPRGQRATPELATTAVPSNDGDENAAPHVCECELVPTKKNGKDAFCCKHPRCEKIVIGMGNAKEHRRTHDGKRKNFPCNKSCGSACGKVFMRKSDMKRHVKEVHQIGTERCQCKRVFKRRTDLERHCFKAGQAHWAIDNSGPATA
ncbi:hypothetical protein HK405_010194 [Cladochytrium tenue]|nr:hypothetical protein HK405_010194 [Cladochytrium tenue]